MSVIVISPKCSSKSARYLAENLNAAYGNPYRDSIQTSNYGVVINFGVSVPISAHKIINKPQTVINAVDKLRTFKLLKGTDAECVPWTTDPKVAIDWYKAGNKIVARTTTTGNRSAGTTIISDLEGINLENYVLFSGYVHHNHEYRVNVVGGKIIDIIEKTVNKETDTFDMSVVKDKTIHKEMQPIANAVTKNLGLDFYGIDILKAKNGKLFLLEVNSAPALFGQPGVKFIEAMKGLI